MAFDDNPNWFAGNPLDRAYAKRAEAGFLERVFSSAETVVAPLWRGDPLITRDGAGFLSGAALAETRGAPVVFLGMLKDVPYAAVDLSGLASTAETAPFAELGRYAPLREAAGAVGRTDLAIIGHARWLFEWHRKHQRCAVCGGATTMRDGGAKRQCDACGAEHFPRSDPVAIVLAVHDDACLLGRSPHFPPGFLSALAGFVEAGETPEEAARRELMEEAGIELTDVRYQFSQPWPFPASLMMGFLAEAKARELTLDDEEIVEARWIDRADMRRLIAGESVGDVKIPPKFTIARQLMERWAR